MHFFNRYRKSVNLIALFIFCGLHAFFLIRIIYETHHYGVLIGTSLLLIFIFGAYYKASHDTHEHSRWDFINVLAVIVGASTTYYLHAYTSIDAVMASAGVGVLVSYLPEINKKSALLQEMPAAIYCGSFVGMSNQLVAQHTWFIWYAGGMAGMLYLIAKNMLNGFGGKLGSIAFGGVVFTNLLYFIWG